MEKPRTIIGLILPLAWLIIATAIAIPAYSTTPAEYRGQIQSAEMDVLWELDEYESGSEGEREMIEEILGHVPATEKIEWPGGSVETDNRWLAEKIGIYQKETDPTARAAILGEISERLSAIVLEVERLEAATAADPTKDSDKQKLAEILSRPEYQRASGDSQSLFAQWIERFINWIAGLFPSQSPSPSGDAGFGAITYWLRILLFVVVIGVIGFLVYKFAPAIFPQLKRKGRADGDRVILGETIRANETSADLLDEADRLAREGNLRSAIRKGYIALLCELSDRKLIGLAQHKTNRDYLRDLRQNAGLQTNVRGLTNKFEQHWYGDRKAENADWEEFRRDYRRTVDH